MAGKWVRNRAGRHTWVSNSGEVLAEIYRYYSRWNVRVFVAGEDAHLHDIAKTFRTLAEAKPCAETFYEERTAELLRRRAEWAVDSVNEARAAGILPEHATNVSDKMWGRTATGNTFHKVDELSRGKCSRGFRLVGLLRTREEAEARTDMRVTMCRRCKDLDDMERRADQILADKADAAETSGFCPKRHMLEENGECWHPLCLNEGPSRILCENGQDQDECSELDPCESCWSCQQEETDQIERSMGLDREDPTEPEQAEPGPWFTTQAMYAKVLVRTGGTVRFDLYGPTGECLGLGAVLGVKTFDSEWRPTLHPPTSV